MKKVIWSLLVFAALTFTQSAPATASVLTLLMDGTFDAQSSLNGTYFSAPTYFTLSATFDPTARVYNDHATTTSYLTTALFTIGSSTYSSSPIEVFFVLPGSVPPYSVGLMVDTTPGDFSGNLFLAAFANTNPTLNPLSPSDTVFSSYQYSFVNSTDLDPITADPVLIIPLSTGGNLTIHGLDPLAGDPNAQLVPEPTTYALLGLGLGCVAFARRKMNKINQAENA